MSDILLIEDRGAVRVLTMNRPDKLNALNRALCDAIAAAAREAGADDSVAALVLTGAGRAFSAGADMKEAAAHAGRSHRQTMQAAPSVTVHFDAVAGIDKPVVAAIEGYALGGGAALALSCDLAVAGANAVLGYPEVKRGLAATAVTPTLVAQIGRKAAAELLLISENIDAERAAAIGLVNRVVAEGAAVEAAVAMAETMAAYDHDALWMTKRMIRRSADLALADAHAMALDNMLVMGGFEKEDRS